MGKGLSYKREVLYSDEFTEIVLITWPAGSKSAPHDHGKSFGMVLVLKGEVYEKRYGKSSKKGMGVRHYKVREVMEEGPDLIHVMGNSSDEEAQTLHVYQPPLKMNFYEESELK